MFEVVNETVRVTRSRTPALANNSVSERRDKEPRRASGELDWMKEQEKGGWGWSRLQQSGLQRKLLGMFPLQRFLVITGPGTLWEPFP